MWPGPTPSAKPVSWAPIPLRPRRWNAARGRLRRGGTQVVVAAHGEAVLAWRLASGAGLSSVRVGPLPHLQEVADAAARRPAYVVVLADRDGTDIIAHAAGDQVPARRFEVGDRPGAQHDPHPDRPPAQHHGERHLTDSEPESGGQRNAEFIAGRVAEAADSVAAHIVLGAGDEHILDAIASHLPETIGPVTAIAGGRAADGLDTHLSAGISAALDEITGAAIDAVGDLVASLAEGPNPGAVRGIKAVARATGRAAGRRAAGGGRRGPGRRRGLELPDRRAVRPSS